MHKCLLFNATQDAMTGRTLGPYRIAHILRDNGWDAEVIDFMSYWSLSQLKILARSRITADTKFLGFSFLIFKPIPNFNEFCAWIRKTYPHIKLIAGVSAGHPSGIDHMDYYVEGYGENALLELLKYLFSNGTRPRFELNKFNGAHLISANSSYPAFPMRSLLVKYQDRDFIVPGEWLSIEAARGCKFACDFCTFPVTGVKGDYTRDADDFYEHMMDAYDRFGITVYNITDDTFNDRTDKITKFADVVERLPFTPWFSGFIRADLLISREKDIVELDRMNFLGHLYGIETFNKAAGKAIGKGMDPERVKQGLIDIQEYFNKRNRPYRGVASMIVGLPTESIEDIQNTQNWFEKHWINQTVVWNVLTLVTYTGIKQSAILKDPAKYGYQQMDTDDFESIKRTSTHALNDMYDYSMYHTWHWKNEHMNHYEAEKLRTELAKRSHDSFKLDHWAMSSWVFPMSMTLEEKMQLTHHEYRQGLASPYTQIAAYIRKKLDYTGS